MQLLPKQFDQLSDVLKELSAIVFGGIVVGSIVSGSASYALVSVGIIFYVILVVLCIYFKKLGE